MTYPNLFIVGAPKCATTALAQYLGAHPQVQTMPKEVHCFGADLDVRMPGGRMSLQKYEERAAQLGAKAPVVLDASVYYLSSVSAAEEIYRYNPNARIIIMLRKPAELIRSMHQQQLKSMDEDLTDLAEALAAEPDRIKGQRIPRGSIGVPGILYRRVASFADQVERYQKVFPADQIKIFLYDEMIADTAAVYRSACRFAGVEPDGAAKLERINAAATVRSSTLVELQRRVLFRFEIYRKVGKVLPKAIRAPLWKAWQALLYREGKVQLGDPAILPMLTAEFVTDVTRLEKLIGRDLSAWKV